MCLPRRKKGFERGRRRCRSFFCVELLCSYYVNSQAKKECRETTGKPETEEAERKEEKGGRDGGEGRGEEDTGHDRTELLRISTSLSSPVLSCCSGRIALGGAGLRWHPDAARQGAAGLRTARQLPAPPRHTPRAHTPPPPPPPGSSSRRSVHESYRGVVLLRRATD